MKRTPLIIGGVVGLAALWSVGWYAGKTLYVTPQADAVVENLRGGSLFFSYETRTIGGFPFGYDVAYEGVSISDQSALWRWTTDWARLKTGVGNVGAVTASVAQASSLVVEPAMFGGPEGAPPAVFDIASEDLTATFSGDDAAGEAQIQAASVLLTQKSGAGVISGGEGALTGLDADVSFQQDDDQYDVDFQADAISFGYRLSPDGVTETTSKSEMTGVRIQVAARAFGGGDVAAMIANDGAVRIAFSADASSGSGGSSGGPSRPPVTVDYRGEKTKALIEVADGRAHYSGDANDMAMEIKVDTPGPFPGPAFSLDEMNVELEMPLKQAAEAQPYLLSLAIEDLDLKDDLWAAFDPQEKLNRDAMNLEAKLSGAARVLTDFAGVAAQSQSPIDLETLEIEALEVDALGVAAKATGAFEIAGDAARADGAMDVEIKGAFALLDDLSAAGLVPPPAIDAYRALILQFAQQSGDDDHLTTRIETRRGQVSVNGQPIGR